MSLGPDYTDPRPIAEVVLAMRRQAEACRRAGYLVAAMAYESDADLLESVIAKPAIPAKKEH